MYVVEVSIGLGVCIAIKQVLSLLSEAGLVEFVEVVVAGFDVEVRKAWVLVAEYGGSQETGLFAYDIAYVHPWSHTVVANIDAKERGFCRDNCFRKIRHAP